MEELNGYTPPASLNLSDFQDAIGDAVVQAIIKIGIRVNREELFQADTEDVEAPQGIVKICPQCGKEFTQGKIKQKIYCSFECQKAHAQSAAFRRYHDRKNKELEVHE